VPDALPSIDPIAVAWARLAISGFLEWFFAILLVGLVGAAGLFGVFLVIQLFRNPARGSRPRA
jgi:hypothetical protein